MNVFVASQLPVRTRAGTDLVVGLREVDDHERIGVARGDLLGLGVVARLLGVVLHPLADLSALAFPGLDERVAEALSVGVVAVAEVDGLALCSAELVVHRRRKRRSLEVVGRRYPVEEAVVLDRR